MIQAATDATTQEQLKTMNETLRDIKTILATGELGTLRTVAKVKGSDIIFEKKFNDFELSWEWRVTTGGNNGVQYATYGASSSLQINTTSTNNRNINIFGNATPAVP